MDTTKWVAIIDAGSSSSRFFVYKINNYVFVEEKCHVEYKHPLTYGAAVESWALEFVRKLTQSYSHPIDAPEKIDLYILATAGMRGQTKYYDEYLHEWLEKSEHKYFEVKHSFTITGRYEAFCAWLATNYELHNLYLKFDPEDDCGEVNLAIATGGTCGIVETGGASMQIAFLSDQDIENSITRKGIGTVFCKSYLRGGANKIHSVCPEPKCYVDYAAIVRGLPSKDILPNKLYARGKSLISALKTLKKGDSVAAINNLATSIQSDESHYYPRSNAYYAHWLQERLWNILNTMDNDEAADVSWTLGAALDITVYRAKVLSDGENPKNDEYYIEEFKSDNPC